MNRTMGRLSLVLLPISYLLAGAGAATGSSPSSVANAHGNPEQNGPRHVHQWNQASAGPHRSGGERLPLPAAADPAAGGPDAGVRRQRLRLGIAGDTLS
ncbi:hypothetical protein [Synechococcus sp. BA-132 BA5]|uniref:hypothetical protein n=1 Tax=Synechococcus sp. BA-132 BA5 TaxID=3110252 RepID=UPI002B1F3F0F|nr:hypothetical protein [Synechococcus sp. BA-132 BA5]MEA5417318.1 hypothetical protein [Synechococcus sp. BA-132 BA5]